MSIICRRSNADTTDCFLNDNFGHKSDFLLKLISTNKKILVILSRRNENTNLMFWRFGTDKCFYLLLFNFIYTCAIDEISRNFSSLFSNFPYIQTTLVRHIFLTAIRVLEFESTYLLSKHICCSATIIRYVYD